MAARCTGPKRKLEPPAEREKGDRGKLGLSAVGLPKLWEAEGAEVA